MAYQKYYVTITTDRVDWATSHISIKASFMHPSKLWAPHMTVLHLYLANSQTLKHLLLKEQTPRTLRVRKPTFKETETHHKVITW